jgi:hypothetical protein
MEKICKECGDKFNGRADAKFCSGYCRSAHNNKEHQNANTYVRKVNGILRKNRKILSTLNPDGKKKVRAADLDKEGFDFNYFTNIYTTKSGKVYHFCYDQGYISTGNDWFVLVTKHEYV